MENEGRIQRNIPIDSQVASATNAVLDAKKTPREDNTWHQETMENLCDLVANNPEALQELIRQQKGQQ